MFPPQKKKSLETKSPGSARLKYVHSSGPLSFQHQQGIDSFSKNLKKKAAGNWLSVKKKSPSSSAQFIIDLDGDIFSHSTASMYFSCWSIYGRRRRRSCRLCGLFLEKKNEREDYRLWTGCVYVCILTEGFVCERKKVLSRHICKQFPWRSHF